MTVLSRCGIPGPQPQLIIGNMTDYYRYGYNECFERWRQKYGKIFGYYLGAKPFVVVTDPELLKLIQVKEFNQFFHRPYVVPGGLYRNPKFHQQINRVGPFKWRAMRQSMSPWFSSLQLRSLIPTIEQCSDVMLGKLEPLAESGREFNIYRVFEGMTMDAIHRTAFGVMSDPQLNVETNELMDAHRTTLSAKTSEWLATLLLCFPEFSAVINPLRDILEKLCELFGLSSDEKLWQNIEAIVDTRIQGYREGIRGGDSYKDILELMIEKLEDRDPDKRLTKTEIIANVLGIDEAAFESPANNLGFVFHYLVNCPDIQERVYEELECVVLQESSGSLSYDTLKRLEYTEAVILEAFRIYPTDPLFISHSPDRDFVYRESLTLPKGVDIRVPMYQLHRDPDHWPQPDQFLPDRFLGSDRQKSINPFVYQPFGVGPRLCPGKRFSIFEVKLIIAQILLHYRVVRGLLTEPLDSLELDFKLFSLSPKNGIYVRLLPRKFK